MRLIVLVVLLIATNVQAQVSIKPQRPTTKKVVDVEMRHFDAGLLYGAAVSDMQFTKMLHEAQKSAIDAAKERRDKCCEAMEELRSLMKKATDETATKELRAKAEESIWTLRGWVRMNKVYGITSFNKETPHEKVEEALTNAVKEAEKTIRERLEHLAALKLKIKDTRAAYDVALRNYDQATVIWVQIRSYQLDLERNELLRDIAAKLERLVAEPQRTAIRKDIEDIDTIKE